MPLNQYHPCRGTSKCIPDPERAAAFYFSPGM